LLNEHQLAPGREWDWPAEVLTQDPSSCLVTCPTEIKALSTASLIKKHQTSLASSKATTEGVLV
jgi:hypothetical protein